MEISKAQLEVIAANTAYAGDFRNGWDKSLTSVRSIEMVPLMSARPDRSISAELAGIAAVVVRRIWRLRLTAGNATDLLARVTPLLKPGR